MHSSLLIQTRFCFFTEESNIIDNIELCGLPVDYFYVFIICLDSDSDGTHSLQRIHWRASTVRLNFSIYLFFVCLFFDKETYSSTSLMA